MTYPTISDFVTAVRNAAGRFAKLEVKPVVDDNGNPVFVAGNFAAVFKATVAPGDQLVAIKMFTRDLPQLQRRQQMVVDLVERLGARHLVDIGFMPDEIFVTSMIASGNEFPVVLMPWIEGETMGSAVKRLCHKLHGKGLAALTRAWASICLDMLGKGIAHGDLKHDNVLVTPQGQLRLIDYDSFFAPPLKGLPSVLLGGNSFQHPRRDSRHFDATLDHFSMLVFALSLRALTLDTGLYETYNTGENFILSREDFVARAPTALTGRLLESSDSLVRKWTDLLLKIPRSGSIAVPGMKQVLRDAQQVTEEPVSGRQGGAFSFLGR